MILGFFFSIIFLRLTNRKRIANIIISVFYFVTSIAIGCNPLLFTNLYQVLPHAIRIEWILLSLICPLLHLYYITFVYNRLKLALIDIILLISTGVFILSMLPFYFQSPAAKIAYYRSILAGNFFLSDLIFTIILSILSILFFFRSYQINREYTKKLKQQFSSIERLNSVWLKSGLIFCLALNICIISILVLLALGQPYYLVYRIIPLLASATIFIFGFTGVVQQDVHSQISKTYDLTDDCLTDLEEDAELSSRLRNYMQKKKPFRNVDLTLSQLAKEISIPPRKLARLIAADFDLSFYDFINRYRINEVKKNMTGIHYGSPDMFSLAVDAGFRTKSDFFTVFKNLLHMTPEQYLKAYVYRQPAGEKKKTIGLLIDNLYDYSSVNILLGTKKFCEEHGISLLCFAGGSRTSPPHDMANRTAVYDLADVESIDGLLAISSCLGSDVPFDELRSFYAGFSSLPLINIGVPVPGMPGISVENRRGMDELMSHLLDDHGYRRIAFITGPDRNREAGIRLEVYKEKLAEHKIPFDPRLVAAGNFVMHSGGEAVRTFLEERKLEIDVIVAANDYMAIGAIQELQARGIKVPEDIAVVGFDDFLEGKYTVSPLTTVKQPSFELGYRAANNLLLVIEGKKIDKEISLPSQLVQRNSCGCSKYANVVASPFIQERKVKQTRIDYQKIKERVLREIKRVVGAEFPLLTTFIQRSKWVNELVDALLLSIQEQNNAHFLVVFEHIMKQAAAMRVDVVSWTQYASYFYEFLLKLFFTRRERHSIMQIYLRTNEIIFNTGSIIQDYPMAMNYKLGMRLFHVVRRLVSVHEMERLKEWILMDFPLLGINSCYLCVFDKEYYGDTAQYARIVTAYKNHKEITYADEDRRFPSEQVIPRGTRTLGPGETYIIMALYSGNEQMGYVLYDVGNSEFAFYELLTVQLSIALRVVLFYEQMQKQIENKAAKNRFDIAFSEKYLKSKIPEQKARKMYQALLEYMQSEKPYLHSDCSLQDFSDALGIPRNSLSYIINKYAKCNFFDFVNRFRLDYAIHHMKSQLRLDFNIIDIAFDAGFKSKSTFNKLFKSYTGLTPSDFRRTHSESAAE